MKLAPLCALLVAIPLTAAFAWNQGVTPASAPTGQGGAAPIALYTGSSATGVLQEALNDALTKAQAALGKTGAAGQPFAWTMGPVSGTRGGKANSQQIDVQIQVPLVPNGASR